MKKQKNKNRTKKLVEKERALPAFCGGSDELERNYIERLMES